MLAFKVFCLFSFMDGDRLDQAGLAALNFDGWRRQSLACTVVMNP